MLLERVRALARAGYAALLRRNVMGALTVVYDGDIVGKVPMPDLVRQHDFALWLRLTRQHGAAFGLDEGLATYRVGAGSLSSDKLRAAGDTWLVLRWHERLPLPRAAASLSYAFHGLRRRGIERAKS